MKSAYQIKWVCFRFEAKKKIVKYVTKNTNAMVIGNVVLTHSKKDAETIKNNCIDTNYSKYHYFEITDKQFGLIRNTNVPYIGWDIKELLNLKKTKMPNLITNNNGNVTLIPVTNTQFIGSMVLGRTSFWL